MRLCWSCGTVGRICAAASKSRLDDVGRRGMSGDFGAHWQQHHAPPRWALSTTAGPWEAQLLLQSVERLTRANRARPRRQGGGEAWRYGTTKAARLGMRACRMTAVWYSSTESSSE